MKVTTPATEYSGTLALFADKPLPVVPRFGFKAGDFMGAARRLLEWRHLTPQKKLQSLNSVLAPAVTAMLVLALAYQLAELAWTLIPDDREDTTLPPVVAATAEPTAPATKTTDYSTLIDSHLFGEPVAEPIAPAAIDPELAPATTLNLVLRATIADLADDRGGVAIIASGSTERPYFVADNIDGAGGALLHAIHGDRVVLNRDGRLETLWLAPAYDAGRVGPAMPSPLARPVPALPLAPEAASLQGAIDDNASRLGEILRFAPHVERGRMIGFRLRPGDRPEPFAELGFESGDVVTEINGMAMTKVGRGTQVFERLSESSMANVTLIRDGVARVLTIDTSLIE